MTMHWSAVRNEERSSPAKKQVVNRTLCCCTGSYMISFVRDFEKLFQTVVFDALGGKKNDLLLGEPNRLRLSLFGPAPLRRVPPLPHPPVVRQVFKISISF